MKLSIATILTGFLSLFFSATTLPHTDFSEYFLRLALTFLILGLLFSICILPWLKGSFSEIWVPALRYGIFTVFFVFDLGYLTSALSTLI